jgi:hypothetical protein
LSVGHLREFEVGWADRPGSSTKGHGDVDLGVASYGKYIVRLKPLLWGSDRLTIREVALKVTSRRCRARNLSIDRLNSAGGAANESRTGIDSRVRFASGGKSDAVTLDGHTCIVSSV